MLAYLFWHERRPEVEADRYVALLDDFHRALAAAPPPGFRGSWSVRLAAAPWDAGPGEPIEDWYLVDDWTALGTLNDAAVRAPRQAPHARGAAARRRRAGDQRRGRRLRAPARRARRPARVGRLAGEARPHALRRVRP